MTRASALILTPAVLLLLGACTGGGAPDAGPTRDPTSTPSTLPVFPSPTPRLGEARGVAGARAVAEEQVRRYTSQDYAGAWELWSARGQRAVSRYDYARVSYACAGLAELSVVDVRRVGPRRAVATLLRPGGTVDYPLVYERGRWRWQPAADVLRSFRAGVEAVVASC